MNILKKIYTKKTLIYLIIFSIILLATHSFTKNLNVDEREHLYSSFMVYRGELPYRDFFQHHHPLLWYIFAPFLIFFNNTPYIWYILRAFTLFILILTALYTSKITYQITKNKTFSLISPIIYLNLYILKISAIEFRPDNLMMLFYIIGLHYLLKYFNSNSPKELVKSYIFFFLSFFTLQKIVFILLATGISILYITKSNPKKQIETISMLLVPLFLIGLYILYLYQTSSLKDYFELCWLLNLKRNITYVFYEKSIWYLPITIFIISLYLILRAKSTNIKIISFIYIFQTLALSHSPYIQYFITLQPFIAIILSYLLYITPKKFYSLAILIFITISCISSINEHIHCKKHLAPLQKFITLSKIELESAKPNDLVINDHYYVGGLRKSAYGYYWYGHDAIARLDYRLFKRHPWPDVKQIIQIRKPKFISANPILNCLKDNNDITQHCTIDTKIESKDIPFFHKASELGYQLIL